MKARISLMISMIIAASLIMSACGSDKAAEQPQTDQHQGTAHIKQAANGDLQETTASIDKLPSFLDKTAAEVVTGYKTAASVADLLSSIPCYCGCGDSAGHKSNLNCFISEVKPDGSVVWDDHGTRCGVCLETAEATAELKKQGKSIKEIRSIIDEHYKEGYAPPTPTPLPV